MVLPEIVAVGIYNSYVDAKNTTISKNRKTSMFEIELPMEEGGVSYIGSKSKSIVPDMIICAKPGQVRHTRFPFKCYYVHIIVRDETLYQTLTGVSDFLEIENRAFYKDLFEKLIAHYNRFEDSENLLLQSLILELIYSISKDCKEVISSANSRGSRTLIEDAIAYIQEHLTEDLSLEQLANQVSVSPIYFHNVFKRSVGKTLREYVEEQRIKRAIHLLISTDASLTQIAFECGFSSQSYFSYVFKRKMKMTPRAYVREVYNQYWK